MREKIVFGTTKIDDRYAESMRSLFLLHLPKFQWRRNKSNESTDHTAMIKSFDARLLQNRFTISQWRLNSKETNETQRTKKSLAKS